MVRATTLRWSVPLVIAITVLIATLLAAGTPHKHRPPAGEVRIEKILDFQLPEI
jgi:hypothetical protein